jgi:hypothetical protein
LLSNRRPAGLRSKTLIDFQPPVHYFR